MRGYAANSLAMVYDGADLEYLGLIDLPAVLADFVRSHGASLHLASFEQQGGSGRASVRSVASTSGAMWHGVALEDGEEQELSMCLAMLRSGVSGTGCGMAGNFVVRGELGEGDGIQVRVDILEPHIHHVLVPGFVSVQSRAEGCCLRPF